VGGGKIDVVIEGHPFQVSCQPKSKGQKEKLAKLGVTPIEAGSGYPDKTILERIAAAIFSK